DVRDHRILRERVDLSTDRLEDGAPLNPLLQPDAVPRCEPVDVAARCGDDDFGRRFDAARKAIGNLPRHPGPIPLGRQRRRDDTTRDQRAENPRGAADYTRPGHVSAHGEPRSRAPKAQPVPRLRPDDSSTTIYIYGLSIHDRMAQGDCATCLVRLTSTERSSC